jgi:CXXC-20-CXXC protein
MNLFKEDLHRELQSVSLSKEKKQLITSKVNAKLHNKKRRINWQYRFVLATFTIFAFGFSYLLWQEGGFTSKSQGAAPVEPVATTNWQVLDNDLLKAILFISFFLILRTSIKKRLQKGGKGLPVCVKCSEEWSYRQALKQSMKNREMTCPHCGQKQYRTKKSVLKGGLLNLFIPFTVLVPHLFDHFLLGIVVYVCCSTYFMISLSPYYINLQEEDSFNDPLW